MIMTKGKMITALKNAGIRKTPEGKSLSSVKSYEITKLYYEHCKEKGDIND